MIEICRRRGSATPSSRSGNWY